MCAGRVVGLRGKGIVLQVKAEEELRVGDRGVSKAQYEFVNADTSEYQHDTPAKVQSFASSPSLLQPNFRPHRRSNEHHGEQAPQSLGHQSDKCWTVKSGR
jgi:hypothetical protein